MKLKLTTLLLLLTIVCKSQEESEDKLALFLGIGAGANNHYGGFGYGTSFTYAYKLHTITAFLSGGHHSNYLPYTQDQFLMYRSKSYGLVYGPGYWGKYFSANIKTGIGYVSTIDYLWYNDQPGHAPSSNNYSSENRSYQGFAWPLQLEGGVHGETIGFNIQFTNMVSKKNFDFRLLAGLTFGLQR